MTGGFHRLAANWLLPTSLLLNLALIVWVIANCNADKSAATISEPFKIIQDDKTAESKALQAIDQLNRPIEPPDFWAAIANNERYSNRRRGACVFQLFKRHIKAGMSLAEASRMMGGATWLNIDCVHRFDVMGGHVPVRGSPGSVFSMFLDSPEHAVYFSISGPTMSHLELVEALKGDKRSSAAGRVLVDVWPATPS